MKFLKLASTATALVLSTSANAALVTQTLEGVTIGDEIYNVTFIQESYADYLSEKAASYEIYGYGYREYNTFSAVEPSITNIDVNSWNTAIAIRDAAGAGYDFTPGNDLTSLGGFWVISGTDTLNFTGTYGDTYNIINTSRYLTENVNASYAQLELVSSVPVPAAVWLFGSGLIGLIGVARRKKA